MNNSDSRNPTGGVGGGGPSTIVVTPSYGSSLPANTASARKARCTTGVGFIKTIHGILNIVIIVALVCVLISAGVANANDGSRADRVSAASSAKVSAVSTRNAVIVFAVFGLILILADTILHMTSLINRLPAKFDLIFIIVMLVFAGIYFILACCAAAWEKKMDDTAGLIGGIQHKGAAAAASFFLFVTMFAIIADFTLRLTHPVRDENI